VTAPAPAAQKKGLVQEFRDFLATGDLMTIAVAFIMGAAVKQLVDSFVNDIVMGLVGLLVPCQDVLDETGAPTGVKDCTGIAGKAYKSFAYGSFLNQIVVFLLTAVAVFALIKFYKATTRRSLALEGPTEVDLLTEIRDELRSRNG
jgi:large conductance mechanosensitive channel